MEAAGLALGAVGLTGLFTACVDCYQLVRRGAALDKDYKIIETKFNNQELRLSTWGRACGLLDADGYDARLNEPALRARITATLECIKELFDDEKELKKRFGLKSCGVSAVLPVVGRNTLAIRSSGTSSAEPTLPRRRASFFFWKKQQRSMSRFWDGARWAISDREKFSELVQHLKDFNDDLEAMTRPLAEVYVRQRQIVQMEIEEIGEIETLEEIALASQDDADVISDTVSLRIESIRSGSSILTGTAASGTTKSFKTALTSIPVTIDEMLEETAPAPVDAVLREKPRLSAYKCVVVGDYDAGKTRLLSAFTLGYMPTHYIPTVFENYMTHCRVDGFEVNLSLWDTTAQENYERLRPLAYSRAHVILLCFRANNPTATTKSSILQKWAPELMRYCPGAPIILVGLNHPNDSDDDETEPILPEKSDETTKHSPIKLLHTTDASASGSGPRIKHNEQSGTERRQNQEEEEPFIPFSIRREIGSPEYFFCDPITGFGVDELFEYATRAAIRFGDRQVVARSGFMDRVRGFVGGH